MLKKLLYTLFISLALITGSCKNDLQVTDTWKETMVVFGLLNQKDTAHYIKINKAYLGEADALQMGGVYDSIQYATQLSVTLERWMNNNLVSTHILSRDTTIAKGPGVFAFPNQVLYKTTDAIFPDSKYKLRITNTETGKEVTANTELVQNFIITAPLPAQTIVGFTNPVSPFRVEWNSAYNGRLYQLAIRFYYVRKDKITGIKTQDSVDWIWAERKSNTIGGGETMSEEFMGETWYRFIGKTVKNDGSVYLIPGTISNPNNHLAFIVYAGAEEFSTYMDVNEPSSTILQERPVYTNVQNGIGLFSSRLYVKKGNMELGNNSPSNRSLDSLYAGQFTYQLGFCTENSLSPFFCQ